MSSNTAKNESLPTSVWMLFIGIIAALMGMGLIGPVLPTLSTQLAASPSEVTLLYSSYNLVMAIGALITGAISTRLGLKRALLAGIVIIGVFAAIAGFATNIWTIIGLRGLWAIGSSLFFATGLAAMVTLAGVAKARSIVLFEAAVGIGVAAGPLIGGVLGQFSWRYPFIGIGVMMAVVFVLLLIKLPNVKEDLGAKSSTSLRDPFRAMKHRSIAALGTANCLYNFGFFTLLAYSPLALGLSPFSIGVIFLGWGVLLGFSSYFMAPKLKKQFGTIKSLYLMLSLFIVLLLVMGIWTSDILIMSACIIISGLLFGNSNSLFTNAVMDASPVEASTTSAAFSFLRMIGGAIAPFMAGILAEIYSPHVPFLVGSCFVICAIIFIVLNRHHILPVKSKIVEEKPKAAVLKVKDFMIPDVISIEPDATIKELLKLLTTHHIGGVPVVDYQNKLIGMVSDGDIIRYLAPKEESVHDFIYDIFMEEGETEKEVLKEKINTTVDKLMHKKQIYTLKKEDTLEKAIQLLSKHHFKKLPVLDLDGKVTGIISRGDISNNLMKILSQK
ncbi:MFS transporter [Methanobacterium sp.]|uniref:MFS transporter n=1 Tax=Methanobacterium sp. TaxID=2164 RepID=UPI003C7787C8